MQSAGKRIVSAVCSISSGMSTQLCLALCTLFPMLRPLRNHQPTVSSGPHPGLSGPLEPFREGPAIEGAETHQLREQGPGCVGLGGPACRPLPLLPGGRQRRDQRLGPSSHRQPPPAPHTHTLSLGPWEYWGWAGVSGEQQKVICSPLQSCVARLG